MDNDFCIFSFTKENYPRTLLLLVVVRMNKTYTLTFFFFCELHLRSSITMSFYAPINTV